MSEHQGRLVTMWLSDTGSNFKTIVCEDSSQSSVTSQVQTTKTKCGSFSAPDTPETSFSGSGVVNGSPAANQCSYKQLEAWARSNTLLWFIRRNEADAANGVDAGEVVYLDGRGYLTEVTETSAEGDVIKFNWAFQASGDVDNSSDS